MLLLSAECVSFAAFIMVFGSAKTLGKGIPLNAGILRSSVNCVTVAWAPIIKGKRFLEVESAH